MYIELYKTPNKALSCLVLKCSGEWRGGEGGGGWRGTRRSDEQIQSSTLEIRTTGVNIDLNLHVVALTLFYA